MSANVFGIVAYTSLNITISLYEHFVKFNKTSYQETSLFVNYFYSFSPKVECNAFDRRVTSWIDNVSPRRRGSISARSHATRISSFFAFPSGIDVCKLLNNVFL